MQLLLTMKVLLFIVLLSSVWKSATLQCVSRTIGVQNPSASSGSIDGLADMNYILLGSDTDYTVDCCGYVTEWQLVASQAGTVYLQVWRPTTGNDYQLVGENVETVVSGIQPAPIAISAVNQISIQPGDRIGWFADGANIIEHKSVGGSPDVTTTAIARPAVGASVTWPKSFTSSDTYAIMAVANGGTGPSIDSPPDNTVYSITNDVAVSTFLSTVTWSDPDVVDMLTITMTTNSKFAFTPMTGTGDLTVATSLAGPDSTENLVFTVVDFCGNMDQITVVVQITNEPPVLHDFPAAVTLSEDETTQTLLYTINATDTVDPVTCSFSPAVADPFSILPVSGTSDYGIYVDNNPNLDYDVKRSYTFTVKCNDGYKDSNTGIFYVFLQKDTTTPCTTTDRYRTFFEDCRNIPWFAACMLVLLIIVGILGWMIRTCSGDNGCKAFQRQCSTTPATKS